MLPTAQLSNTAYQIFRLAPSFSDVQLLFPRLLYQSHSLHSQSVTGMTDCLLISIFFFLIIEPLYISWASTTQRLHLPASFASISGHVAKVCPIEIE